MRVTTWAAAAMLAAVSAGAAGQTGAAPPAGAHDHVVTMANMTYGKLPQGVKVGDTIIWVNRDTVVHSATARDRSFDVRLNPGQTIRMPVRKAGSFAIYCIYHPAMRGTLAVGA